MAEMDYNGYLRILDRALRALKSLNAHAQNILALQALHSATAYPPQRCLRQVLSC